MKLQVWLELWKCLGQVSSGKVLSPSVDKVVQDKISVSGISFTAVMDDIVRSAECGIGRDFLLRNFFGCSTHFNLLYFNPRKRKSRAAEPNLLDKSFCVATSHFLINPASSFCPCQVSGSGGNPITASRSTAACNCWSASS